MALTGFCAIRPGSARLNSASSSCLLLIENPEQLNKHRSPQVDGVFVETPTPSLLVCFSFLHKTLALKQLSAALSLFT